LHQLFTVLRQSNGDDLMDEAVKPSGILSNILRIQRPYNATHIRTLDSTPGCVSSSFAFYGLLVAFCDEFASQNVSRAPHSPQQWTGQEKCRGVPAWRLSSIRDRRYWIGLLNGTGVFQSSRQGPLCRSTVTDCGCSFPI
jgi:hypothetical protein